VGPTPTGPSVLRIAITSLPAADPRALDTPDGLFLASLVFDGLADYDHETLEAVPAAAARWQMLEGGRAFVFRLREGVQFHDGTPVRAQDFVAAWNRLADPFRPSPFAFLLERVEGFHEYNVTLDQDHITGVVARDDRTLEVRLTEPWPDFVSLLGHPALSPVPEASAFPGYSARPVGNGPFQLAGELAPGAPIALTAFPGYYGPAPGVAGLELSVYADPEAAWPDFLAGDLDVSPIPAGLVPEAEAQFGSEGVVTLARLVHCGFNLRDPRFRDPSLRRAVSLAIDRQRLVDRVYGPVAVPADGVVPPTIPGYARGACGALCRLDQAEAAALVADLPARSRSFALDYASSPVGDRLARELAAQLAGVGLEVNPRAHQEREYRELLERGGQRFFCLVSVADYPRQQALLEPLMLSTSPDNHTGVEDGRLDRLLERARAARDPRVRERLYRKAERRGLSLAPLVPLAWFRSRLAAGPDVGGLAVNPLGRFDAAALSLEP
jgi:peptide/nickel transport system substrate-binding protein/oligopeptide transport system substrate-binding protein